MEKILGNAVAVLLWAAMILVLMVAISNHIPNTPKVNTVYLDQNTVR
jgi:hypothetical protein